MTRKINIGESMQTATATEEIVQGVHVLTVRGSRLASETAGDFRKFLHKRIGSGAEKIIIDLSNVDFIDSMGIGAIVTAKKSLEGNGGLIITGANKNVMSMFQLTRLDHIFQILASQDEAIKVLQL